MTLVPLPPEIIAEAGREETRLRWPECVPKYVEIPDAGGTVLWHLYENLTPALCEQAVEYHTRRAIRNLKRWLIEPKRGRARRIGQDIVKARCFACCYVGLTKRFDLDEDFMPFPHFQYEIP